jgi:hypothetical protein
MSDQTDALLFQLVELQKRQLDMTERMLAGQQEALAGQREALAGQKIAVERQQLALNRQRSGLRLVYILIVVAFLAILGPWLYSWLRYLSSR